MALDILQICAVGLITAFCAMILKDSKSEVSLIITIAGSIIILLMLLESLGQVFSVLKGLVDKTGISGEIVTILFKIIGIGYIADFSAGIIEEAGSKSLAEKIILAGKIIILVVSLPIITTLFNLIAGLVK